LRRRCRSAGRPADAARGRGRRASGHAGYPARHPPTRPHPPARRRPHPAGAVRAARPGPGRSDRETGPAGPDADGTPRGLGDAATGMRPSQAAAYHSTQHPAPSTQHHREAAHHGGRTIGVGCPAHRARSVSAVAYARHSSPGRLARPWPRRVTPSDRIIAPSQWQTRPRIIRCRRTRERPTRTSTSLPRIRPPIRPGDGRAYRCGSIRGPGPPAPDPWRTRTAREPGTKPGTLHWGRRTATAPAGRIPLNRHLSPGDRHLKYQYVRILRFMSKTAFSNNSWRPSPPYRQYPSIPTITAKTVIPQSGDAPHSGRRRPSPPARPTYPRKPPNPLPSNSHDGSSEFLALCSPKEIHSAA
jgi:hypothetical protein